MDRAELTKEMCYLSLALQGDLGRCLPSVNTWPIRREMEARFNHLLETLGYLKEQ